VAMLFRSPTPESIAAAQNAGLAVCTHLIVKGRAAAGLAGHVSNIPSNIPRRKMHSAQPAERIDESPLYQIASLLKALRVSFS